MNTDYNVSQEISLFLLQMVKTCLCFSSNIIKIKTLKRKKIPQSTTFIKKITRSPSEKLRRDF